jgi:hypothetical protein
MNMNNDNLIRAMEKAPIGSDPYIFNNSAIYRNPVILSKFIEQRPRLLDGEIGIVNTV